MRFYKWFTVSVATAAMPVATYDTALLVQGCIVPIKMSVLLRSFVRVVHYVCNAAPRGCAPQLHCIALHLCFQVLCPYIGPRITMQAHMRELVTGMKEPRSVVCIVAQCSAFSSSVHSALTVRLVFRWCCFDGIFLHPACFVGVALMGSFCTPRVSWTVPCTAWLIQFTHPLARTETACMAW